MSDSPLADFLACPRCDAPLAQGADGFRCGGCKVDFPNLGGLPFLFAEPQYARAEWRARGQHAISELAAEQQQCEREMAGAGLADKTRERLELLRNAQAQQQICLGQLLKPLLDNSAAAPRETYLALRTRLPLDQGLNTYYQNIHRDWAWGEAENQHALDLVSSMLPGTTSRILVLGAGAGRLAYDLHNKRDAGDTVALDFNPLLSLTGAALSAGEDVELWEFPIAPRRLDDAAIGRTLSAEKCREGLTFLTADALRPPFLPGSFDVVVTPWLIDILPVEFSELAARINGLLNEDGRWINFGSLAFAGPQRAQRYSLEETLQLVASQGFSEPDWREDSLPYMCSPASRHGRQELVVTFAADKRENAVRPARHTALPEWLVTGKEAVPVLREFQMQAASTRIYAFVMGMIDGRRSIRDMAKLMEQQKLMSREEAEASIRGFLTRMFDDSQR